MVSPDSAERHRRGAQSVRSFGDCGCRVRDSSSIDIEGRAVDGDTVWPVRVDA